MRELRQSELNSKERNILKELDVNCRESASAIGKKLRMSKQVVNYHIDNMIKKGFIKEFITYVDTQKLGYTFYNILIKLKYMTNEEKSKIINSLKAISNVVWLSSFRGGDWQMIISILAKDVGEFSMFLDEVLNSLKGKLLDYNFFIVISASQLGYKKMYNSRGEYNYHAKISQEGSEYLSANDIKILKVIANDARLSLVDIAQKSKLTIEKVRYSLKKLEKEKVIQAYKPLVNVSKLGFLWHVVFLRLKTSSEEEKERFVKYLKSLPEIFYVVRGVGNCNLMVEFQTKTFEEFEKVKDIVSKEFHGMIADEKTVQLADEHKCTYFPGSISG